MKKTILLFIAVLFGVSAAGQLVGDGLTPATAYCGTITSSQSWTFAYNNGTIYVGQAGNADLTIGTGGSLTIEAGVTVKFCTTASDLIITNTGILTAIGTSVSNITFTKNAQASWGHISFQNMTTGFTTQSTIDYCIIEFGRKNTGPSNVEAYGGGLHINFTFVTVSHSIIRNNFAGWGGGIFVNKNSSPTFFNCKIYNNSSTNAGGGFYCWTNSNSNITNSLIYNNSTGLDGGGAFFLGDNCGNIRIISCTISNNSSSAPLRGQNIQFNKTPPNRIKVINSILWGSNNSIFHLGYSPNVNDFTNCAIQDVSTPASTYTNCLDLNSSNSDPAGPNFIATDGTDWSIKYISPCRDAGTSTGAPLTDYLGNGRIGPYDIGAYEVQYSRWTGATSTAWETAANWLSNILPLSVSAVVIPDVTNDPVISAADVTVSEVLTEISGILTVGPNRLLSALKLTNRGSFILNPNGKATITTIVNNGILRLESDASGISSLITDSFSGNDATVQIYLTGGNPGAPTLKLNKWHFISTPVASLPVSTFAPTYTLNVARWYDNQVSGSLSTGWIAYDGYRYSSGQMGGPTFSSLSPGLGYDFFAATDQKYTFAGQLNTGSILMNLDFTTPPGNISLNGFNLLGNPFSSGLDWDYIINSTSYPLNTSKSLYFTRNNSQCSYIGGVGIPVDVTGIIPPMQGFFVKTLSTGNSLTIPPAARVQGNIHPRYKGLQIIPLVRLSLAEGILTDETVVRFDAAAKSGLDLDFDAPKMFLAPDVLSIYSTAEGSNFAINGLPFPDTFVEIPIIVNLTAAGDHTISATQLEGLDNFDVTLKDNTTGFIADLKTTPVLTFSADVGSVAGRFVLKVGTITTGTENPVTSKDKFNIYTSDNFITIQTVSDQWDGKPGSVKVMDLTGKTVGDLNNAEFSKNSLVRVASPRTKGMYVVEIKSGVMRYVGKVVVK